MAEATQAPIRDGIHSMGAMVMAASIGYAVGILLAPRSGRETREMIGHKADKIKGAAQEKMNEAKTRVHDMAKTARQRAEDMKARGQELMDEAIDARPNARASS